VEIEVGEGLEAVVVLVGEAVAGKGGVVVMVVGEGSIGVEAAAAVAVEGSLEGGVAVRGVEVEVRPIDHVAPRNASIRRYNV